MLEKRAGAGSTRRIGTVKSLGKPQIPKTTESQKREEDIQKYGLRLRLRLRMKSYIAEDVDCYEVLARYATTAAPHSSPIQ